MAAAWRGKGARHTRYVPLHSSPLTALASAPCAAVNTLFFCSLSRPLSIFPEGTLHRMKQRWAARGWLGRCAAAIACCYCGSGAAAAPPAKGSSGARAASGGSRDGRAPTVDSGSSSRPGSWSKAAIQPPPEAEADVEGGKEVDNESDAEDWEPSSAGAHRSCAGRVWAAGRSAGAGWPGQPWPNQLKLLLPTAMNSCRNCARTLPVHCLQGTAAPCAWATSCSSACSGCRWRRWWRPSPQAPWEPLVRQREEGGGRGRDTCMLTDRIV